MRYRFDDSAREIHINAHDTPMPWMNYLSNGTLHAMISQAGGGLAFYRSPQIWRINHYRFFHLPTDRSGFYTYIADGDAVWCPTCEPVRQRPESFSASHGLGYTRFSAARRGLRVAACYTIGPLENCMIWSLKLSSDTDRHIQLFPFVELGMMEYERELRWQCYNKHQLKVTWDAGLEALLYEYGVENQPRPEETPLVWFAADVPVASHDGDRDEFVGAYRSEEMPLRVENRRCTGSSLLGGDPCFALQIELDLPAGETREVNIFLGASATQQDACAALARCRAAGFAQRSLAAVKQGWDTLLSRQQCITERENVRRMVNIWNPYQLAVNFQFSRNISYYATGTFRGVGFRDTAQDAMAYAAMNPAAALDKLLCLLAQQYRDGHANHYFFPTEGFAPVTSVRSDNHLWLAFLARQILMETGDAAFLHESVPYYDGGGGTVWQHLEQAVDFTLRHMGERGFPLMLESDWNDMLSKVCREGKGESVWTAMQFGAALLFMEEMARVAALPDPGYHDLYNRQKELVNTAAWDGAWYRRAISDDGRFIGSAAEPYAKIWLNTQSWAVISGMAGRERALAAMDSVHTHLNTGMGIKKLHPAMVDYPTKQDPLTHYHPGCGENGSVFCHANCWVIIAEALLKREARVDAYYTQLLPMVAQQAAGEWRYKAEPYVYSSNIFGPESDRFGLANVSWLTGTAAWMYHAVTQYIFGVRPAWDGLTVDPCVPASWGPVTVERVFRGCRYHITIRANRAVHIPHVDGRTSHEVLVEEGKPL